MDAPLEKRKCIFLYAPQYYNSTFGYSCKFCKISRFRDYSKASFIGGGGGGKSLSYALMGGGVKIVFNFFLFIAHQTSPPPFMEVKMSCNN